jgi:citrate synthase
MLIEALDKVESGAAMEAVARDLVQKKLDDPALGISSLMLKDPAAQRTFARAKKLGVAGQYIALTEAMVKAAQEISDEPVDLDMLGAIGATMLDLGFTPEATWAIIAVTRSFGAGAHAIEEMEGEGVTRLGEELTPEENYDGPKERPVPPLAERDKIARAAQTYTLDAWHKAFEGRKKLRGSGFSIVEEIRDPSKKS